MLNSEVKNMDLINSMQKYKVTSVILWLVQYTRYRLGKGQYWKDYSKDLIQTYMQQEEKRNVDKIMKEVMFYTYIYHMGPEEYFIYDFGCLNSKGRAKYLGKGEKTLINNSKNKLEDREIFNNKWCAYEHFKTYYKRDVIKIEKESDWLSFEKFSKKHTSFIVKLIDKSCGVGIFVINMDSEKRTRKEVFLSILDSGVCVIEELVEQAPEISMIHPASVNTIRIATYLDGEKVHFLFAGLRMGVDGSVVDNASAGGLMAGIDIETGIVYTPGYRRNDEMYVVHPNSNQQIVGAIIPKWEELKDLVTKVAKEIPTLRLIGWDFALSQEGWVIIEGNCDPQYVGVQMWSKNGLREKMEELGIV